MVWSNINSLCGNLYELTNICKDIYLFTKIVLYYEIFVYFYIFRFDQTKIGPLDSESEFGK